MLCGECDINWHLVKKYTALADEFRLMEKEKIVISETFTVKHGKLERKQV